MKHKCCTANMLLKQRKSFLAGREPSMSLLCCSHLLIRSHSITLKQLAFYSSRALAATTLDGHTQDA